MRRFLGVAGVLLLAVILFRARSEGTAPRPASSSTPAAGPDPAVSAFFRSVESKKPRVDAPIHERYREPGRVREIYWASDEAQVLLSPGASRAALAVGAEVLKDRRADLLLRRRFADRKEFQRWSEELSRKDGVKEVRPVYYARPESWSERSEAGRMLLTRTVAATLPAGQDPAVWASRHGATLGGKVSYLPETYLFTVPGPFDALDVANAMASSGAPLALPQFAAQPRKVAARKLFTPTDPLYAGEQWHLKNTGQYGGTAGQDANVETAWDATKGSGVVIALIDDGVQTNHPDLAAGYLGALSFDFNDNDADPSPADPDPMNPDDHGTAVAGVAAARHNNGLGGTGAAPEASIAAIRLISEPVTDSTIGSALSHQNGSIHIKSNSWSYSGDGTLDDQVSHMLDLAAVTDGANNGRGGRGVIYLWAAGNSAGSNDNTNYDAYCTRRQVLSIGAVDRNGVKSFYSEPGAALFICAPSNGGTPDIGITTTDRTGGVGYDSGDYTHANTASGFGGTSSATPLAAGVVALILASNPQLTWRDVQHVLVRTARKNDSGDPGWFTNGGGRQVNHLYGHGVVDAAAAVALAPRYGLAPAEQVATASSGNIALPIADTATTGVYGTPTTHVLNIGTDLKIENLEVVVNITHTYRGDLRVRLSSPSGTTSILALRRGQDGFQDYSNWQFRSTLHWGESSSGNWTLTVDDGASVDVGTLDNWTLRVYGTPNDASAPVAGTVADGAGADAAWSNTTGSATANWTGFSDSQSGALGYEVQLETGAGGVVRAFTGVGQATSTTFTGLSLTPLSSYRFRVRAINHAGLSSEALSNGFTVDTAPPGTSVLSLANTSPNNTGIAALTWTLVADATSGVASYTVERDSGSGFVSVASGLSPSTSTFNQTGLAVGSYVYRIRAFDHAGNASAYSNVVAVVVDTSAPDTAFTSTPPDPSGSTTAVFNFASTEALGGFQLVLDGGTPEANVTGTRTYTGLSLGTHTLSVTASDAAGNTDASPAVYTWVVQAAPVDGVGPVYNSLDQAWAVTNWTLSAPVNGVGWAVDASPSSVAGGLPFRTGKASLNFNNGTDYNSGGTSSGTATSPSINIGAMGSAVLRFWCNYQTDTIETATDQRTVEVLEFPSLKSVTAQQLSTTFGGCAAMGIWHEHSIVIDPVLHPLIVVRFEFNSVNATSNGFAGWFIDEFQISDLQVSVLNQFDVGAGQAIVPGGTTGTGLVEFRSVIAAGVTGNVRFEIEIIPLGGTFSGTPSTSSTGTGAGTVLAAGFSFADGSYRWRARTVNLTSSTTSSWMEFGANAATAADFIVALPPPGDDGGGGGCGALGIEALLLLALRSRRQRR
jgi:subtilisin-like proprotein convertase family protein